MMEGEISFRQPVMFRGDVDSIYLRAVFPKSQQIRSHTITDFQNFLVSGRIEIYFSFDPIIIHLITPLPDSFKKRGRSITYSGIDPANSAGITIPLLSCL